MLHFFCRRFLVAANTFEVVENKTFSPIYGDDVGNFYATFLLFFLTSKRLWNPD